MLSSTEFLYSTSSCSSSEPCSLWEILCVNNVVSGVLFSGLFGFLSFVHAKAFKYLFFAVQGRPGRGGAEAKPPFPARPRPLFALREEAPEGPRDGREAAAARGPLFPPS